VGEQMNLIAAECAESNGQITLKTLKKALFKTTVTFRAMW
jgi:hypothetical protein